jgi:hypothetical protein
MDHDARNSPAIGRASGVNPANRFERVHVEDDLEQLDPLDESTEPKKIPTVFLPNESRRIIATNDSPNVPFGYGINPYRGCARSQISGIAKRESQPSSHLGVPKNLPSPFEPYQNATTPVPYSAHTSGHREVTYSMRIAEIVKLLASPYRTQIAVLGDVPENANCDGFTKFNDVRRMAVLYLESMSVSEGDGGSEGEASWLSRTGFSPDILTDKAHPLRQSMHWLTIALQMLMALDKPLYFTDHGLRSAHEWKLVRHLALEVCEAMGWSLTLNYTSFESLWHDLGAGVIEERDW